jgi:hypothetical protein
MWKKYIKDKIMSRRENPSALKKPLVTVRCLIPGSMGSRVMSGATSPDSSIYRGLADGVCIATHDSWDLEAFSKVWQGLSNWQYRGITAEVLSRGFGLAYFHSMV